jgi:endoglucanase
MFAAAIGIIGLVVVQFGSLDQPFWKGEDPDWQLYKTLFISDDGRVIDTGNQNNSHSEGQGWGMLFAVKNNDQSSFEKLWQWTQENLQIRQDSLFVWRWEADQTDSQADNETDNHTPDTNNATDGDLYIAWALKRAGEKWGKSDYTIAAKTILQDTREKMIRQYADMTVLLPGGEGFEKDDHLILNLSYWVFPALTEFDQIDPSPVWHELHGSGLELINQARFGEWNLPSDWITLTSAGEIKLATDFPPRFSYDAIRVPLSLLWAQVRDQELLKPFQNLSDHFSKQETTPAWINLENDSVAPYQASEGFNGIMTLANALLDDEAIPHVTQDQDYYSASLLMLARQAVAETGTK